MMRKKPRVPVSVVVITFRRPILLGECLQSILRQSVIPEEVLVVDNAPDKSAKQIVIQAGLRAPCTVRYLWERRKGTAHARNAGFGRAAAKVVAFIDDDCEADRHWLRNGYRLMEKSGAGALTGKNINAYSGNVYATCEHYDAERYLMRYLFRSNGQVRNYVVDTKNLFLRKSIMLEKNIRHDTRFAGVNILEDMDLAMQMNAAGIPILFGASTAITHKGRTGATAHLLRELRKGRAQRIFEDKWRKALSTGTADRLVKNLMLDTVIKKRHKEREGNLFASVTGGMGMLDRSAVRIILGISQFAYGVGYLLELLRNYLYDEGRVNRKP